jgi:hypothetical protein
LSVDSDTRLCGSKLCPFEYRHTEVDNRGIHSVKPTMQLELFCDTFRLSNCHRVESKLLEDTMFLRRLALESDCLLIGL